MLRFGILASAIPLLLISGIARDWFPADLQPCIAGDVANVQIARNGWQSTRSVSFTNDPKLATVRVQIVETPDLADLAIADDGDTATAASCGGNDTRRVTITKDAVPGEARIYLSHDDGGDYRVYLASKRMTVEDAAALIVGARSGHENLTAARFKVLPQGD